MRIGLFSDTYPPFINGVSTSVLMLKKALEKKGHEVYVITINNEKTSYKFEENGKLIRIPGLPVGLYDYRLSGIYPIKATRRIKRLKLDVIHCHTEFSIGTYARIISKQFNIPLVHTYHTMYEDYINYITKGYFSGVSQRVVKFFTLFYCDQTISELVVPTKKTYDLFKEKYKVERNIYIVPTGIEVESFYREKFDKKEIYDLKQKLNINRKDFVLLFVGRLSSEKNIEYLIEAQRSLVKKYNNIKLIIVGDGPDQEKLKQLAIKKDCQNNIVFTGKIPLIDMPYYYQMANISVTASKSETQGLTVIESLAASVPVVCIKDESFSNIIVDDLNGYMYETKKEYRNIILDLFSNKSKLQRLSKQARISSNDHSSSNYANKILDVYKIAIDNYKGRKVTFFDRIKRRFGI